MNDYKLDLLVLRQCSTYLFSQPHKNQDSREILGGISEVWGYLDKTLPRVISSKVNSTEYQNSRSWNSLHNCALAVVKVLCMKTIEPHTKIVTPSAAV